MFSPQGQDPTAVKTILFVFLMAMLAHLCTMHLAHGETFLADKTAATASLRGEAKITGDEIRFRDIARWSTGDDATLQPIADLVVARFGPGVGLRGLTLVEVKGLLKDAGVNLATIDFVGPIACRASRTDLELPAEKKLEQAVAVEKNAPVPAADPATTNPAVRTLRRALAEDLGQRLNIAADDIQLSFNAADEAVLGRPEPDNGFLIRPQRVGNLGNVAWVVTLEGKRVFLGGTAKAWRRHVVVNNPVAGREAISADDVSEKRQLVDSLPADPILPLDKVVGQAAARDLKPGQVVTTVMVTAMKLVTQGQDVTVDTRAGGVRLLTAAKALSDGAMGQTVRLRNEATREVFNAVVTGPKRVSLALDSMAGSVR